MLALVVLASLAPDLHTTGINLYVGDLSAQLGYVDGTSEDDRIRGHLVFAHDVLAAADTTRLSPELRVERAKNLDRLERYARAGRFPRNDDHPDARRPTFVDNSGAICAVGALYASDRGYPAAVHVAERYKYAFIAQIDDPDLLAWQKTSGLSLAELALIQPSYDAPPSSSERMWLPWGLTDREQFGAPRLSLETSIAEADRFDSLVTTLHAHSALPGARTTSVYLTMPLGFVIDDRENGLVGAGGTPVMDAPKRWSGNSDVGMYFGSEVWTGPATIVRIGALLPTATEHAETPPSVRAGDLVLELQRSYGGRFSASRLSGWRHLPSSWFWFGSPVKLAWRLDAGIDYARTTDGDSAYLVPRAALGLLFSRKHSTISFDASVAHAYESRSDGGLRFTAGTTLRLARRDGNGSAFQPALTFATVRTPEGWSGVFAVDLAVAFAKSDYYSD